MRIDAINWQFKNNSTHYLKILQYLTLFKSLVSLKQKQFSRNQKNANSKIFLSVEDKKIYMKRE